MKYAGKARMADISGKPDTARKAVAEGWVILSRAAWGKIARGEIPKGDVLAVAQVAGILAAKATPRILQLCHPIHLSQVAVNFALPEAGKVRIEATVKTVAPTGAEMEALTAATAAALCVYDMAKPVDRGIVIEGIRLLRKTGGKSGDYAAPDRGISRPSRPASRAASRKSPGGSGKAPKRSR